MDHTADAKFTASGRTLEEAFTHAAEAFTAVLIEPKKVKANATKTIALTSKRLPTLLYDFLDQLLFFLSAESFLTKTVKTISIKENRGIFTLKATVVGDSLKHSYSTDGDIKAVTYNDMDIRKTKKGYEMTAVLDL